MRRHLLSTEISMRSSACFIKHQGGMQTLLLPASADSILFYNLYSILYKLQRPAAFNVSLSFYAPTCDSTAL